MADPVAFQVFLVWFLEHEAVTSKSTEVCIDRSSIKTCPEFAPASHTFVSCKPETAAVLKRTVEALMENGAVVRNLENLGERALPYKISKHKQRHRRGGTEPSETLHRFGSQFPLGLGGNTPPSGLGFFSREKRKGENHNQMSHELCRGEYKPFLEGIFKACRLAKLIYYNRLPV
ncbi:small ribosomal subunit protein bS6m isoform X1 [Anas platyrhynchos]|uniref:small ribosomal subunit protein bS6m isoform X1 n=1 Tax=Anas platyrhynchos TaxID=8839 RepID=UPI003AF295C5